MAKGFVIGGAGQDLSGYYTKAQVDAAIKTAVANQKLADHPIGYIYISDSSTSPASLYGGTWEQIASERVLMGASDAHPAGTTVEAGLPNITGKNWYLFGSSGSSVTNSALYFDSMSSWNYGTSWHGAGSGTDYMTQNFDASRSNSIYGNSATVQPAAYYVYIWKRVA